MDEGRLLRVNDGTDLLVERLALIGDATDDRMVGVVASAPNPEKENQRKRNIEPGVVGLPVNHAVYEEESLGRITFRIRRYFCKHVRCILKKLQNVVTTRLRYVNDRN